MFLRYLVPSLAVCASILVPPQAYTAESDTFGPRSLGMGGTGVAVSNGDAGTQFTNPALFGYMRMKGEVGDSEEDARLASDNQNLGNKDFGFSIIDASFGVVAQGEIADLADEIIDSIDQIQDIADKTDMGQDLTAEEVEDSIRVITRLVQLDNPENVIFFDGNAGTGLRFGRFAIGARGFGQAMAFLDEVDSANLGFNDNDTSLGNELDEYLTDISFGGSTDISGGGYTPVILTDDQITALDAVTGIDDEQIVAIDLLLQNPDISNDFTSQEIQEFVDLAIDIPEIWCDGW